MKRVGAGHEGEEGRGRRGLSVLKAPLFFAAIGVSRGLPVNFTLTITPYIDIFREQNTCTSHFFSLFAPFLLNCTEIEPFTENRFGTNPRDKSNRHSESEKIGTRKRVRASSITAREQLVVQTRD